MNIYPNQRALRDPLTGIVASPREWILGWAEDNHNIFSLNEFLADLEEVTFNGNDWINSYIEDNLSNLLGME